MGRQRAGPLRRLRAKLNAAQKRLRMLLPKRPGRAPGKSKIKRKRRHLHRPSRSPNRGVRSKGHISVLLYSPIKSVLLYSPIKCETARLEAARETGWPRAPTQARHVQRSQPPGTATERATQVDKAPARRAPPASKAQTAHTRGGKLSSELSSPI